VAALKASLLESIKREKNNSLEMILVTVIVIDKVIATMIREKANMYPPSILFLKFLSCIYIIYHIYIAIIYTEQRWAIV